jgi:hypothetical protein
VIDLSEHERLRTIQGLLLETPMMSGRHFIHVYIWNEERDDWEPVAAVPIKMMTGPAPQDN